ncbi:MAG: family 43 glycosylhydrolase [Parasporobacterium sp.]|nr:family 43 glycosylhydrolase [Parasporobacterium sp.]
MINPVIKEKAGDPCVLKCGEDYYMSATGGGNRPGREFVCWHSKNLQNWSDPRQILDLDDVSWAQEKAWAPAMVESGGYYYLAFCADQQIGIAVCREPMGRYRDVLGRPLIAKKDYPFQTIDPAFIQDETGKTWFAFGQGKCMISEISLSPGDVRLTGDMVCLSDQIYSQFSHHPDQEDKSIYNEAPDFIRIGGRYLFSWAIYDVMDYRYGMRYAWSRHPMGPYILPLDFDHDNILLQGRHGITGCGHSCVTEYQGEYYILYGRHMEDRTAGWGRDMCCEKISFLDRDHLAAVPTELNRHG